jgi:hypothetical protein
MRPSITWFNAECRLHLPKSWCNSTWRKLRLPQPCTTWSISFRIQKQRPQLIMLWPETSTSTIVLITRTAKFLAGRHLS